MSGLGETAENGETGTVSRVAHMPDQMPDNPATIAATTSMETIQQIMYTNWIWKAQLAVDTSMLPGHVFGLFKIHPRDCHDYLTHISLMFLTWAGSMKIRARFQATFQFGGSLRIGWLPPKFTRAQIAQLPIQTLTAYPNIDLDPKNTCFMEFQASEERNILFHWMEDLNNDDPASFGGWYVFYVAAPLVVSGGGSGEKVTLLVESAGSFNFAQLAPISGSIAPTAGIIDTDLITGQTGCDDFAKIEAIQIHPIAERSIPTGWQYAQATQNRYTRDIVPGITYTQAMKDFVAALDHQPFDAVSVAPTEEIPFSQGGVFRPTIVNKQPHINSEKDAWKIQVTYEPESQQYLDGGFVQMIIKGNNAFPNFKNVVQDPVKASYVVLTQSDSVEPIKIADTAVYTIDSTTPTKDASAMPILQGESLVSFVSLNNRSINIQTSAMKDAIAKSQLQNSTSQIYQLWTTDGTAPLLTVRLTPYGYFTTASTDKVALLTNSKMYFRYIQDLPMSTPIPTTYAERKFVARAARCTRKGWTGEKLEDELWAHY